MSNGSFDGLCGKLLGKLQERGAPAGKFEGMILRCSNLARALALVAAAAFRRAVPRTPRSITRFRLLIPERHIFGVTMRVPDVHDQLTLQMPAWNALYQIRDFSSHMMQVSARDEAGTSAAASQKLDKQTWQRDGRAAPSP